MFGIAEFISHLLVRVSLYLTFYDITIVTTQKGSDYLTNANAHNQLALHGTDLTWSLISEGPGEHCKCQSILSLCFLELG